MVHPIFVARHLRKAETKEVLLVEVGGVGWRSPRIHQRRYGGRLRNACGITAQFRDVGSCDHIQVFYGLRLAGFVEVLLDCNHSQSGQDSGNRDGNQHVHHGECSAAQ